MTGSVRARMAFAIYLEPQINLSEAAEGNEGVQRTWKMELDYPYRVIFGIVFAKRDLYNAGVFFSPPFNSIEV